jgi:acetylornithine/N-succinyldiaminopimelate aminotransferase
MVAAKPLACGLPLGVVVSNQKAASTIGPGMHGTTFGGGPLACRVAIECLDIIGELLPSIYRLGADFRVQLTEMARHLTFIREVRGFGLMIGVELDIPGKQIVLDAMAEGLLINCTRDNVLRFLPPYVVTDVEIDRAVKILRRVMQKAKP